MCWPFALASPAILSCQVILHSESNRPGPGPVKFLTAHLINLFNELVLLEIWLWVGVPKLYAPLCVFVVAFPVNYFMVRFALRGKLHAAAKEEE